MAGYPPQHIPPPPPPPPIGYGGEGFMKKPTSGKAIASLICGLCSLVLFMCYFPVIASLVSIVLGILAIMETGREGPRAGRGMAIAGMITSVVAIGALVAFHIGLTMLGNAAEEELRKAATASIEKDQRLILDRLKQYYNANEQSLGPGGPLFVDSNGRVVLPRADAPPSDTPVARVTGTLELRHLIGEHELGFGKVEGGNEVGWELVITGKASAIIRAKGWVGDVMREVTIQDIGKDAYMQTVP